MTAQTEAVDQPFTPLVAGIVSSMFEQSRVTTATLIDSLTAQLADRDAELAAIRERINALLGGDYMPTPAAILDALYPTQALIAHYRQEDET